MLALASHVETGDFRNFEAAQDAVEAFAASGSFRHRTGRLRQLSDELDRVEADRPECVTFLRALKRYVLRRLEESFVLDPVATAIDASSRGSAATPLSDFRDRSSPARGAAGPS